jgi:hypothetical protein
MEPDRRQSDLGQLAGEHPRESLGMQRAAIGTAEHDTVISEPGTHQQPLGSLPFAVLPQRVIV